MHTIVRSCITKELSYMVRLVFAVLYKLAWTESCRHDMAAKWHEKYIEHMEARILVWLGLVFLFGLV
jgi:hypothetical protein